MTRIQRKPVAALIAGAAATLLGAAAPVAASGPTAGAAMSVGGLVAYGPFFATDGRVFGATLVIPASPATSSGTTGVDFTRPWVSLSIETNFAPPLGIGSQYSCNSVANPTTWNAGTPVTAPLWGSSVSPLSGISADVNCADGSTYRVTWNDTTFGGTVPWGTFDGQGEDVVDWGAGGSMSGDHGTVVTTYTTTEAADMTVCVVQANAACTPVAGGGFTSGRVYPVSQLILVEAQQ